jgi:hypothetical protein
MRYRASNGILPPVELTEAEARRDYIDAPFVTGKFGKSFVVCPVGEMGQVLTIAATVYTPIKQAPRRPRRRPTSQR